MTTHLPSKLTLAAILLTSATGCQFLNLGAPSSDPGYEDPNGGVGGSGGDSKPLPLLPLKSGNTWAYWVVAADGSKTVKYNIVRDQIMVGGNGLHQNDMAFPVHTTTGPMDLPSLVTLQQVDGDKIVNYRGETFNAQHQVAVDETWEPHQLELDQSRTMAGASWLESYTQITRPLGAIPITIQQKEPWTVVGEEMVTLPDFATPFPAIVFQKGAPTAAPPTTDGGATDGGGATDAARPTGPTLASGGWNEAADAGAPMLKTFWYTRGIGKIKEAGGGEPMEYLTYFSLP